MDRGTALDWCLAVRLLTVLAPELIFVIDFDTGLVVAVLTYVAFDDLLFFEGPLVAFLAYLNLLQSLDDGLLRSLAEFGSAVSDIPVDIFQILLRWQI